ncbi:MAG TPA: hypothetical protein VGP12_04015, partial [Nitrosospira sp.]|nr:hypothetical protein [Nitrosospira sp.]
MTTDLSQAFIYTVMPWLVLIRELPWVAILVQLFMMWIAVFIFHRVGTAILERFAAPFPFSRRLVRYGH